MSTAKTPSSRASSPQAPNRHKAAGKAGEPLTYAKYLERVNWRHAFFYVGELPVAGLPPPAACPHCGARDVNLSINETEQYRSAVAECGECGARGPEAGSNDGAVRRLHELDVKAGRTVNHCVLSVAAAQWNEREGGKS